MKSKYFVITALVFLALGLSGCTVLDKLGITTETTEPSAETETVQDIPEAEAVPEVEAVPSAPVIPSDEESRDITVLIVANLLAAKYSVDVTTIEVTISDARDEFASGSSGPVGGGPGGGYWYAALVDGAWVIAADGNGVILCSEIAPYDFPVDMIPECYDEATEQSVVRADPMGDNTLDTPEDPALP